MTCTIILAAEDWEESAPLAALVNQLVLCAANVQAFIVKPTESVKQITESCFPLEGSFSPVRVDSVDRLREEIDAVVRPDDGSILAAFGNNDFLESLRVAAQSSKTPLCACGDLHSEPDLLFPTLVKSIREAIKPAPYLVGVSMKQSRYSELAARGMLSLDPFDGLLIVPVGCGVPVVEMDAVVEKCTDFLEKAESDDGFLKASQSQALIDLHAQLAANPEVCVVDPFSSVSKVTDRSIFTALMSDMEARGIAAGVVLKISPAPYFTTASLSNTNGFIDSMQAAGMDFPIILKPCVACGVKGSHKHAIVYKREGLENLHFNGLPACVQGYVNHGGLQYKVYVVGKQVFCRAEASTPDIHPDQTPAEPVLFFDTLESLRSSMMQHQTNQVGAIAASKQQHGHASVEQMLQGINDSIGVGCVGVIDKIQDVARGHAGLDFHAIVVIAKFLKDKLGLTIFGFDVVVQENCGAHIVVDVNFFPSCRRVPGIEQTIRAAIFDKISAHKRRISL